MDHFQQIFQILVKPPLYFFWQPKLAAFLPTHPKQSLVLFEYERRHRFVYGGLERASFRAIEES